MLLQNALGGSLGVCNWYSNDMGTLGAKKSAALRDCQVLVLKNIIQNQNIFRPVSPVVLLLKQPLLKPHRFRQIWMHLRHQIKALSQLKWNIGKKKSIFFSSSCFNCRLLRVKY